MTDKHTTEYLEKLGKVGLSTDAKARMRSELDTYADFHAVRVAEVGRSIEQVQKNSVFTLFTNTKIGIMKATLLIALLIGTGGTSFAAQGAVPGEFLYPVKIHVNENVRSAFAVGADAEAKLQADLLVERVEEAKKLAHDGKLEGEVAANVNAGITAQTQKTIAVSAQADAETGTEVKSQVSVALTGLVDDLQNTDATASSDTSVGLETFITGLVDLTTSTGIGTELAGEIQVESIVERAQSRLQALQGTVNASAEMSAEMKADFEAKLQSAAAFVEDAQTELRTQAEAQAQASAQKADEILGEIESALSLMGDVKIEEGTGHIIDIDLHSSTSVSSEGEESETSTETIIDAGASLENDMIDAAVDAQAKASQMLGL